MADKPVKKIRHYTIANLRLNVEEARKGRTWLLLPEGFRDRDSGEIYKLPSAKPALQELATIPIPSKKMDSGCIYLRRAVKEAQRRWMNKEPTSVAIERQEKRIQEKANTVHRQTKVLLQDVRKAVNNVKEEAERCGDSLKDLFSVVREIALGQLKAHLAGEKWHGEKISSAAARQWFSIVSSAVKGLGMPSDQKTAAHEAIIEEAAQAIRDTQDAVSRAPGSDDETEQ